MGAVNREGDTSERLTDAIAAALADLERLLGAEERYQATTWPVDQLADANGRGWQAPGAGCDRVPR
jgi:hypothetical protein